MTPARPGERLADRTGPRPAAPGPDDVPLDGIDDDLAADLAAEPVDLDHLEALFAPPWTTVTPNARYL